MLILKLFQLGSGSLWSASWSGCLAFFLGGGGWIARWKIPIGILFAAPPNGFCTPSHAGVREKGVFHTSSLFAQLARGCLGLQDKVFLDSPLSK